MHFYTSVIEEIEVYSIDKEVEFAVLHMGPLARALQDNARGWVTSLGKFLNESAKEALTNLHSQLTV